VRNIGVENIEIMEMNTRLQQIARNFAIPYIDLYNHITDSSGNLSRIYTKDGIHLDADGYLVWRKLIEPHLK
jgi:lysophospholipase L1-like esterase